MIVFCRGAKFPKLGFRPNRSTAPLAPHAKTFNLNSIQVRNDGESKANQKYLWLHAVIHPYPCVLRGLSVMRHLPLGAQKNMGENRALHKRPLFPSKQETNSNCPVALHREKKQTAAPSFSRVHTRSHVLVHKHRLYRNALMEIFTQEKEKQWSRWLVTGKVGKDAAAEENSNYRCRLSRGQIIKE